MIYKLARGKPSAKRQLRLDRRCLAHVPLMQTV